MVAVIVILFLLNINLWIRLHNLIRYDIDFFDRNIEMHNRAIRECNLSINETKEKIDSILHGILEDTEHESVVTQDQIDEIINRIEELEKSDFPKFDDALNEGLQNLLNYNFDVARGGKK